MEVVVCREAKQVHGAVSCPCPGVTMRPTGGVRESNQAVIHRGEAPLLHCCFGTTL